MGSLSLVHPRKDAPPYINSFTPILTGRFFASNSGTSVRVLLVLHPFAAAFVAFFLWFGPSSLIFNLFLASLALAGFAYEASRAKRDLQSSMLLDPTGRHAA